MRAELSEWQAAARGGVNVDSERTFSTTHWSEGTGQRRHTLMQLKDT